MANTTDLPAPLERTHLSPHNFTISYFLTRDDGHEQLDLNAPYQRDSVWDLDRRVALIRSLLMGLPIGSVITSTVDSGSVLRVVDGKQRIETIRGFVAGMFAVPGWWFSGEWLTDPADRANHVYYQMLSDNGRFRFGNINFPTLALDASTEYILNPNHDPEREKQSGCPDNLKRYLHRRRSDVEIVAIEAELYGLINGQGVAQTDAEMSHAAQVAAEHRAAL